LIRLGPACEPNVCVCVRVPGGGGGRERGERNRTQSDVSNRI
jgi:hypothetical protein